MNFIVNKWRMEPSLNTLTHCETGEIRRLGEYHFILLETLANNADTVLSRSFLISEVWKNRVVGANSLPTAIHALRAAIDDDGKQQEIIKTIPKKGYLFNKSYLQIDEAQVTQNLAEINSVDNSETLRMKQIADISAASSLTENQETHDAKKIVLTNNTQAQNTNSLLSTQKKTKRGLITLAVFAVALLLLTFIFYLEKPPAQLAEDIPVLIKEEVKNTDRITVYRLTHQGINKTEHASLDHRLSARMPEINALLTRQQTLLTMYYKISLNRASFDLIFTNQCQHTQQLVLGLENWQTNRNQLEEILYHETENTLNAMPKC
ncbi:TPA: transcriptional regulator [Citrobacter freundii]